MPAARSAPADLDQARREVDTVTACLREGFPPVSPAGCTTTKSAVRVAADRLGVDRRSLAERIGTPERPGSHARRFGLSADWGAPVRGPTDAPASRVFAELAAPPSPGATGAWRRPVARQIAANTSDEVMTVLAIGDFHDKPGLSKERATWIGRLAAEKRPDAIVSIGDWADLGSLSSHEPPGSARQAAQTTFAQDEESLHESLAAFHRDLGIGQIPTWITWGNHENRAHRAANLDPRRCSDLPLRVEQAYAQCRWESVEFGKFLTLAGCSFVHVPLNIMGREMGGMHLERSVANHSTSSVVMGHTHRRGMFSASKVGENRQITCLNLGTAMPSGYIAPYAKLSVTGWSYGVYMLRLRRGVIVSEKFWDMDELRESFGD